MDYSDSCLVYLSRFSLRRKTQQTTTWRVVWEFGALGWGCFCFFHFNQNVSRESPPIPILNHELVVIVRRKDHHRRGVTRAGALLISRRILHDEKARRRRDDRGRHDRQKKNDEHHCCRPRACPLLCSFSLFIL